ncbi:MAG: TIGR01777 family oxidoreductase [Chloroflexota bacterium]
MSDQRRVVVTGATGLIGRALCKKLREHGYDVVVFSRSPDKARQAVPGATEYVAWQAAETGDWAKAIDGAYAVISLAGASIAGQRWNEAYKQELYDSRIVATRGLVKAMEQAQSKPEVFVSGSAVGYYGWSDDTPLDEDAAPGKDFLAQLCVDWEREAAAAEQLGIRTSMIRTGIVLDKDEGALSQLLLPFKMFVGGPVLPGTQWLSWIHLVDQVGIIMLALEDERVRGAINATAPAPQTNRDFSATLANVMGRPSWLPIPGFGLQLLFGEMADALLINGQRVLPHKADEYGYQFTYPNLEPALQEILS